MAFFNDTLCQIREKIITKEQWNKHLFSCRHLYTKVIGDWSACFPQNKTDWG